MRKYSEEQVKKLAEKYKKEEISEIEFSKKYKTDLRYQCKVHKLEYPIINLKAINHEKKVVYDFKNITNDKESYILGILYADGYIQKRNTVAISLIHTDSYLLKEIKNYISPKSNLVKKENSILYKIQSERLCSNLRNIGLSENKTKEMYFPELPKEFYPGFIRGFFDGDGTAFTDCGRLRCNICCPDFEFLSKIKIILEENEISCKIYKENRKGKVLQIPINKYNSSGLTIARMDMYRLFPLKKDNIRKFGEFMYRNSTLHLKRKFEKFNSNIDMKL